jgi:hypothetical protein
MPPSATDLSDLSASILTRKQREFLLGQSNIERASRDERAIRSRIRDRTVLSVFDLRTLLCELEQRDREKVGEILQGTEGSEAEKTANITNRCSNAMGFFVSLLLDLRSLSTVDSIDLILESVFHSAVREAFIRNGESVEQIEIDISIEQGRRFEELEETDLIDLPRETLGQMLNTGRISPEEYSRAILAKNSEDGNKDNG